MKKIAFLIGLVITALLLLLVIAYGVWWSSMQGDVARLEKTIAYHNQQIIVHNTATKLEVKQVHAIGFPFHSRVRVEAPSLRFDFLQEHYNITFAYADLSLRDSNQGSYDVVYPTRFTADYQKEPAANEHYEVSIAPFIKLLLRAQGDSQQCSNFPGQPPCPAVAADAALISFAAQLPSNLLLTMHLNGQAQTRSFQPPSVPIPLYETIPGDLHSPLETFVTMLHLAMVDKVP